MLYTPPEYLIWKLSQLAFNITWLKNHFREQSFSENVSKLLPRDFDTWNTREKNLSQSPRKAFQERLILVYLVFTCYWRQICSTQLSKPSPNLRSWAPLLIYDATVIYKSSTIYYSDICTTSQKRFQVVKADQLANGHRRFGKILKVWKKFSRDNLIFFNWQALPHLSTSVTMFIDTLLEFCSNYYFS